MLYSFQSLFLLLLAFFSNHTSTLHILLPSDPSISSVLLEDASHLSDKFECDPKGFFRKRPNFSSCGGAIHLLPTNPIIGTFHPSGMWPDPRFQLPQSKTVGNCRVSIDFVGGQSQDDGSWLQINQVASTLNVACMKRGTFTGGKTTTGSNSRIQITISYSENYENGSNNQTLLNEAFNLTT